MKNLFSFRIMQQVSSSIKVFAAFCMVVLLSFCITTNVIAQPTVTVDPVHSDECGGVNLCCLHFTVTVHTGETLKYFDFIISGTGTGHPDACWDLSCAATNSIINRTTNANSDATISDDQAIAWNFGTGIVGPATFEFILCPVDPTCSQFNNWTNLAWTLGYNNGPIVIGPTNVSLPPTCDARSACPDCDKIDVSSHICFEQICLTRKWPASDITSFTLHFCGTGGSTVLPTYPCTSLTGGGCITSPTLDAGSTGWNIGPPITNGGCTDITVSTNTNPLASCQSVCIDIPKCSTAWAGTVSVTTDGTCTDNSAASFKKGSNQQFVVLGNTSQNYPNPLSEQTRFKTTIPFEIVTEGLAKISIINVSGKVVFTDAQEFSGAGKHFFYFTGEQLPAGKYFYTIESPLGAVIVKQSLLLVK